MRSQVEIWSDGQGGVEWLHSSMNAEICKCRAQLIPNGDWTCINLWTQAALGGVFRTISLDRRLPRSLPPAECSVAAFFSVPMRCVEAPFEAFQSAGNATQASEAS